MRFLIQGAGSIGQRHYNNVRSLGHEAAFLRSGVAKRPFVQSFYDAQKSEGHPVQEYLTLAEACEQWNPDALIIATPNHLHLSAAQQGVARGLPLLIEKPAHNTSEGLVSLIDAVEAKRVPVLVGYNLRFHPLLIQARALLLQGKIGTPLSVHVEVGEAIEDWHPWEDYRDTYAPYVASGGGALLCFSHDIDYLYWCMGMPTKIAAGGGKVTPLAGDAEDLVQSLWTYADGRVATMHIDYYQRPKVRTMKIVGTEGTLIWDAYGALTYTTRSTGTTSMIEVPAGFERNDMFVSELTHFIACIQGIEEPICSLKESVEVLNIIDQMKRALYAEQ